MIIRPSISLAAIVAIAAIACGCGSSSSGSTELTTGSLGKAQFLKQANAICERQLKGFVGEIAAYEKQHGEPSKSGGDPRAEATAAVLVPKLETDIEEIRALGAPSGEVSRVRAYLVAVEQALGKTTEQPLSSLAQIGEEFQRADALGTAYGLKACVLG